MNLPKESVKLLQQFFKDKPVLKAYLYGSYARGTATLDSDIDLLLEMDYSSHVGLEYIQMAIDLERLLNAKVSLSTTDSISKHIIAAVDADKVLIYQRL